MKKTKNLIAIALAAFLFGTETSCQKAENNNTNTNQNSAAASQPSSASAQSDAPAAGTPTAAYKAAYAARKNKDIAALKKLMSKDIIEFMTMLGEADEKNKKTLDEMLIEMCLTPQAATDEARNEKIDGDTATIEYLDERGNWQTMDFVKEDGAWKLTIAKADMPSPVKK